MTASTVHRCFAANLQRTVLQLKLEHIRRDPNRGFLGVVQISVRGTGFGTIRTVPETFRVVYATDSSRWDRFAA